MYKRELWGCRECARAFLSSLLDASERGEGGFERNARKRTGRAGGRDGWMVARALLSVFSTRAIYKSASLSFLGLNKTPRWIDAILTATSLSLSLSLFAPAINYNNNNNSRKTRPKKTPWSPTRRRRRKKRSKSSPTVASTSNNSSN
jgi:hypothetical protein